MHLDESVEGETKYNDYDAADSGIQCEHSTDPNQYELLAHSIEYPRELM